MAFLPARIRLPFAYRGAVGDRLYPSTPWQPLYLPDDFGGDRGSR